MILTFAEMRQKEYVLSWLRSCGGRGALIFALIAASLAPASLAASEPAVTPTGHRSPVDVVLAAEGSRLVTANEGSNSLSLLDTASGELLDELPCGVRPASIAVCPDSQYVVAACAYGGEVVVARIEGDQIERHRTIVIGGEPTGVAVSPDGRRAFVGLAASAEVAELDLVEGKVVRKLEVGNWPRYLALSPDGSRLAVGCSGDGEIVVVSTASGEVLYEERLTGGINLGHLQCSSDGLSVYFPWMVYRSNPITPGNIQRGWVLASRIARVRLDGPAYREAISLDVPRKAVADPHGLVLSSDEQRIVVSAGGTHELLVYRLPDLPFVGAGGPGDLIDRKLLEDDDLFYRIEVGGRPLGMAMASDDRTVFVANYLRDSIQEVDIESREIVRELRLSPSIEPSLVRRGMSIFYDGRRSLDQWYSCHSCHYNGGVNSRAMDTLNDGSVLTMKTVLPLQYVQHTRPWTWHGWQTDLHDAMHKSFTTTMQGEPISSEESRAIRAFLGSLELPPNPHLDEDGGLSAAAVRGRELFHSSKAGCATCHQGPYFTDGLVHDVGLGSDEDRYEGFNTPSLLGVYRKVRFLHDGRAKSLLDVLTGPHAPENVAGEPLTTAELQDLVAYLKSL